MNDKEQRARDSDIAKRFSAAVIGSHDDAVRFLAFNNRHLIVAALDAFTEQESAASDVPAGMVEQVDALVALAWEWGHDCAEDDLHNIATIGDSYNESQRENADNAALGSGPVK
ncbi:MAG: hypothetical protein M3R41_05655 [Pseudomonadota bacterium]|nr:hypothetical protein [Pseudomonadota bacterium]